MQLSDNVNAAPVGESLETAANSSRSGGGDPVVHPVVNEDELHRVRAVQFRFGFQGTWKVAGAQIRCHAPSSGEVRPDQRIGVQRGGWGSVSAIAGTPRGGTTGTATYVDGLLHGLVRVRG